MTGFEEPGAKALFDKFGTYICLDVYAIRVRA